MQNAGGQALLYRSPMARDEATYSGAINNAMSYEDVYYNHAGSTIRGGAAQII